MTLSLLFLSVLSLSKFDVVLRLYFDPFTFCFNSVRLLNSYLVWYCNCQMRDELVWSYLPVPLNDKDDEIPLLLELKLKKIRMMTYYERVDFQLILISSSHLV